MTTDTPSQEGTGLPDAANQIASLLDDVFVGEDEASDQQDAGEDEGARDGTETPPEEQETLEADAQQDEGEEGSEDEENADGEGSEQQAQQAPQLHTVKINGKEEQVSLEEALKGYQRQADYSQKTAALAEDRRKFEAEEVQSVRQERAQYAHLLKALADQLQAGMEREPDWETLKANDPVEYLTQREAFRERQERLAAVQFEQNRVAQQQQADTRKQLQARISASQAELVKAIPDAANPAKWKALSAQIKAYGQTLGFTEAELNQAYDHRAIVALNKARMFDELMAKAPKPGQNPRRVGVQRPAPRPLRAGGGNSNVAGSSKQTAMRRLAQTGSVADAAVAIESLLG